MVMKNVLYVKQTEAEINNIRSKMAAKWVIPDDEQAKAIEYVVGVHKGRVIGIYPVLAVGRCLTEEKRVMFEFGYSYNDQDLGVIDRIRYAESQNRVVGTYTDLKWNGVICYGEVITPKWAANRAKEEEEAEV